MSMSDFFINTIDKPVSVDDIISNNCEMLKPISATKAKSEMDKKLIKEINKVIENNINNLNFSFEINMKGYSSQAIDRVIELFHDYDIEKVYSTLYFKIK